MARTTENRKRLLLALLSRCEEVSRRPPLRKRPSYATVSLSEQRDTEEREYGPFCSLPEWFPGISDAQRQSLLRSLYALAREKLVQLTLSPGGRLENAKLTEAGYTEARAIAANEQTNDLCEAQSRMAVLPAGGLASDPGGEPKQSAAMPSPDAPGCPLTAAPTAGRITCPSNPMPAPSGVGNP